MDTGLEYSYLVNLPHYYPYRAIGNALVNYFNQWGIVSQIYDDGFGFRLCVPFPFLADL